MLSCPIHQLRNASLAWQKPQKSSREWLFPMMTACILSQFLSLLTVMIPTSDDNNNSLEDIGVVSDLSCYACGYLAEHWRELNKHTETHIEKRCQECERFIGTNSLFKIGGNWFCTPVCTSLLLYYAVKLFINFCCQILSYYSGCRKSKGSLQIFKLGFRKSTKLLTPRTPLLYKSS